METYYGFVESVLDALLLFEACDRGILPRVTGRLSEEDRIRIRSGSVYIWDEEEACIQRWTDGRRWSSSRPCGNFIVYDELATSHLLGNSILRPNETSQRKTPTEDNDNHSANASNNNNNTEIDNDAEEPQKSRTEGSNQTKSITTSHKRKPILENGLIKRALSMKTACGRRLHLVSYYTLSDIDECRLKIPRNDSALAHVQIPESKYPEITCEIGPNGHKSWRFATAQGRGHASVSPPRSLAPIAPRGVRQLAMTGTQSMTVGVPTLPARPQDRPQQVMPAAEPYTSSSLVPRFSVVAPPLPVSQHQQGYTPGLVGWSRSSDKPVQSAPTSRGQYGVSSSDQPYTDMVPNVPNSFTQEITYPTPGAFPTLYIAHNTEQCRITREHTCMCFDCTRPTTYMPSRSQAPAYPNRPSLHHLYDNVPACHSPRSASLPHYNSGESHTSHIHPTSGMTHSSIPHIHQHVDHQHRTPIASDSEISQYYSPHTAGYPHASQHKSTVNLTPPLYDYKTQHDKVSKQTPYTHQPNAVMAMSSHAEHGLAPQSQHHPHYSHEHLHYHHHYPPPHQHHHLNHHQHTPPHLRHQLHQPMLSSPPTSQEHSLHVTSPCGDMRSNPSPPAIIPSFPVRRSTKIPIIYTSSKSGSEENALSHHAARRSHPYKYAAELRRHQSNAMLFEESTAQNISVKATQYTSPLAVFPRPQV
jgi:hypothetical protein